MSQVSCFWQEVQPRGGENSRRQKSREALESWLEVSVISRRMANGKLKANDGNTPDLHPAQVEAYRRMTPQQKIKLIGRTWRQARNLKISWLRKQNPDWTEDQVLQEIRRIFIHAQT